MKEKVYFNLNLKIETNIEVFIAIKHNLTPFHGFYRRGTKKLDIFGTRLNGNNIVTSHEIAFFLQNNTDLDITKNIVVSNSSNSIFFSDRNVIVFLHNIFSGIHLLYQQNFSSSLTNITFFLNDFINYDINAFKNNVNQQFVAFMYNYYGNSTSIDHNGDGIADLPFEKDLHPLMLSQTHYIIDEGIIQLKSPYSVPIGLENQNNIWAIGLFPFISYYLLFFLFLVIIGSLQIKKRI